MPTGRRLRHARRALATSGLFLLAALFSLPLYLLVSVSLKTPQETAESALAPPSSFQWRNYVEAWQRDAGTGTASLGESLLNSTLITAGSVIVIIIAGSLAGFVLGRRKSRMSDGLYTLFLLAISLPIQLAVVALYPAFSALGLLGNPVAMILFYAGLLTPFAVFLFTGFVRSLPVDFDEAALLDGCSWPQVYVYVALPLLRPVLSTVAVLTGVAIWNDFFGQLVFLLGSGNETLPITVYTFSSQYASQYHLLTAGLVIALIPIVVFYVVLQKRIVEGFSAGIRG